MNESSINNKWKNSQRSFNSIININLNFHKEIKVFKNEGSINNKWRDSLKNFNLIINIIY